MRSSKSVISCFVLVLLISCVFATSYVTSCMDLSANGETYYLRNDLNGSMADGNCIHILGSGITLDCGNHSISSNDTDQDVVGILVAGQGVSIRNCAVDGYIYKPGTGYGLMDDGQSSLSVSGSGFDGNAIGVSVHSTHASIASTSATGNMEDGFIIMDSPGIILTDDRAIGDSRGFYLQSCDYAVLQRNLADSSGFEAGFEITNSSFMRLEQNNATSNSADGFRITAAAPASYSNFTGNIASDNSGDGFYLEDEDNDRLIGNNATGNGANGFHIDYSSGPGSVADRNLLQGNLASGNGFGVRCLPGTYPCPMNGFQIDQSNRTTLRGNLATGNNGYGFVIYRGAYNTVDSNNASSNEAGGFMVSAHEDTRRSHNNLTNNNAIANMGIGFLIRDDNNYLVRNNATGNGAAGFYLNQPRCISWACSGNNNSLVNNTADSNGFNTDFYCPDDPLACNDGFELITVNGTMLSGNKASGNAGNGYDAYQTAFTALDSNGASGNTLNGFLVEDGGSRLSYAINLTGNVATDNGQSIEGASGFMVSASNVYLGSNVADGNTQNGFVISSTILDHAENIVLSGNIARNHHIWNPEACAIMCGGTMFCPLNCTGTRSGFDFSGTTVAVFSPFQVDMIDNKAYGNDYGVIMRNGFLTIAGDRLYGNRVDLDVSEPSAMTSTLNMSYVIFDSDIDGRKNYTTLSLGDNVEEGEHFSIDHAAQPAGDPPYGQPFDNKFINISDHCSLRGGCRTADIDSIVWSWYASADYNNISLWSLGLRGWRLQNDTPSGNRLSLYGMNPVGIYGLFGNYTPREGGGGNNGNPPGGENQTGQNVTQPECTDHDQCAVNERCEAGACAKIQCDCGTVGSHECIPYGCCSDAQCQSGTCDPATHSCVQPQYQCTSDSQCAPDQRCKIPAGAIGGECEPVPVQACGKVSDHRFVPYGYECGTEPGCPSCPNGAECISHKCSSYSISCPKSGIVGDEKVCSAVANEQPCASCDYQIIAPDGNKTSGKTDASGTLALKLQLEGTYRVILMQGGAAMKSIDVAVFPLQKPQEPAKPPAQNGPEILSILGLILLLAAIVLAILYWKRNEKKK